MGTKGQGCLKLHLFNIVLKVLASAEKQGKEIQITSIKQRETKSLLFTDNCVIEIETILQIILTTKGVSKILNTESVSRNQLCFDIIKETKS